MLPVAAYDGRHYVENQAEVRYVSEATAFVCRNGADGVTAFFAGTILVFCFFFITFVWFPFDLTVMGIWLRAF